MNELARTDKHWRHKQIHICMYARFRLHSSRHIASSLLDDTATTASDNEVHIIRWNMKTLSVVECDTYTNLQLEMD